MTNVTLSPHENDAKTRTAARAPAQRRSRDRVERILAAAEELVAARPIDELTIAAFAEKSGIGRATVYQFFPSVPALLNALGRRFLDELYADITESPAIRKARTWQRAVDVTADLVVAFYQRHPAATRLFLGDGSLHGLRLVDQDFDLRFADRLRELWSKSGSLAREQDGDPIQIALTAGISVWSLSVHLHGGITAFYAREAKKLVRNYLASRMG